MLPRIGILGFLLAVSSPALADEGKSMSMDEFQYTLLTFAELTGSDVTARLANLTPEQWQAVYDSFSLRSRFAETVSRMTRRAFDRSWAMPWARSYGAKLQTVEFTPAYPSGSLYDAFTATMPSLGLLSDDGTIPGTSDDRCDANGEADARIAAGIADSAAIVADTACQTIVVILGEGTNLPACVAAGVEHGLALAAHIMIDQCGYQTALVDSAEIEASYENTRRTIAMVNAIENDLATHDADVKALLGNLQATVNETQRLTQILMSRQLEIMRLLITPEGRRTIDPDVLTCTGANCPTEIRCSKGGPLSWPCR